MVLCNLQKAYETKGKEVGIAFEKEVNLSVIDDEWKEHLRELDDLKQSVQNASYEQKDPLLIYKLESFDLFKQMLQKINKEIISFLFRGNLPGAETSQVKQAKLPQKTDMSKLKMSRSELAISNNNTQDKEKEKPVPVRVEKKVGRNDPCPCGSGKKYKHCHGKEV
jgi:preprotein translocase subunit SecA